MTEVIVLLIIAAIEIAAVVTGSHVIAVDWRRREAIAGAQDQTKSETDRSADLWFNRIIGGALGFLIGMLPSLLVFDVSLWFGVIG